jgi:hypothetical protein
MPLVFIMTKRGNDSSRGNLESVPGLVPVATSRRITCPILLILLHLWSWLPHS